MKKFSFSALFQNKTFVVIFSIIVALVCWSSVVFSGDSEDTRTIKNVPVKINASSASYTSLGLDIIDDREYFVDVVVAGPRSVIGSLTANDIVVTPIISGVAAAGEYELELTATKRNELDDYAIRSMSPGTITVRFDNAVSKKFVVDTEIQGLSVREGYLVGTITASPGEVTITGPEVLIENIDRVVARYVVDNELAKTAIFNCDVVLYDRGGNELSADNLKIDSPTIDVTVPVYKEGKLALDIEFTNVPVGFDPASMNYVLSHESIRVAANEQSIDNLKTKIVGYVDLATFQLGEVYSFEVNLPSGFVNLDNVQTVTATFPQEGLASKKLVVSDIRLQNVPENYSVTIETPRINGVTVIGPQADVESLLPGSVIAIVDMSTVSMERGDYSVPVSFEVTANDTTFVVGSYSVLIEVRPN